MGDRKTTRTREVIFKRYRKRPIVIEAWQWDGRATKAVKGWLGDECRVDAIRDGNRIAWLCVETLEGAMKAEPGDWIIRGIKGELYPCKPDIFEQTYEAVDA